ncbi:MAG: hypothetical protein GY711_25035 [bacterium]|nr:hypothetical protein [bacterium]
MRRALEREGLGGERQFRWALAGPIAWKTSSPMLIGSALVMKKIAAIVAAVLLATVMLVRQMNAPGVGPEENPLSAADPGAVEQAPPPIDGPRGASGRVDAKGLDANTLTVEGAGAPALDWIVRGGVAFSDGANGVLPSVRLRLAMYAGY